MSGMSQLLRPSTLILAWATILVLGLVPALLREARTDEAWPLYLAERVLEGQRHGIDFFEVNPPLFVWLSIPAVLAHRAAGLGPWQAWVLMVGALAFASLLLTARQLKGLEHSSGRRSGLLLAAGFAVLVLPRLNYSEREHLALILVLPFVLLAARRASRLGAERGDAALAGLMGGLGFSLKPHFLVTWLLLEVWLARRLGRASLRRPELGTLVAFGVAYFLSVVLLVPDYFPMALRLAPLYHIYLNNGLAGALRMAGPWLLLVVGIVTAVRIVAPQPDDLRDALTVAFLGFLLAAILQQKGLNYHYLSAWGFGVLLLARTWQTRPAKILWYPSGLLVRLGFLMLLVILLEKSSSAGRELSQPKHLRYQPSPEHAELVLLTKRLADGEPIIVLSTNPVGGWPLTLSADAKWASRYMHFWPLAAFYDHELWSLPPRIVVPRPPAERPAAERRFHEEIIQDLQRQRPRLVLVLVPDSTQWGLGGARRFDYLEYFGADPRFRDFMADYQELPQVGSYRLWTRVDR
ncbi:MAG TPA: hypothetical protein VGC81_16705 [Candidatus Methylomirabilis sp.]